jgi:hypothetical protein
MATLQVLAPATWVAVEVAEAASPPALELAPSASPRESTETPFRYIRATGFTSMAELQVFGRPYYSSLLLSYKVGGRRMAPAMERLPSGSNCTLDLASQVVLPSAHPGATIRLGSAGATCSQLGQGFVSVPQENCQQVRLS